MEPSDLTVVDSVPDAFAALVARRCAAGAADRIERIFFSGGPTAAGCYRALAALGGAGHAPPWSEIDAYWGDERCVPTSDPDSNHRTVADALFAEVGPPRSDHPMVPDGLGPEEAAARYDALVAGLPSLGLVHLGMGPDGHCASLFPGSAALELDDPAVQVVANTDPSGRNPHPRVTLTLAAIARADLVVFTVAGAAKRPALAELLAGGDLPAGRVRAPEIRWLVDPDAAPG